MAFRIIIVLALGMGLATADLSYVECSNGFSGNPELEGGRTELELADINNDGNIDILSIGDHGNPYINTLEHGVMVWFGDGNGNWSVFQYGDFGYGGIAVGGVNWDGKWDIGYGMHHNYSGVDLGDDMLEVALGDGTGRLWSAWDDSLMPGGSCWGMFATDFADVDNDGDLDVGSTSFGYGVGLRVFLNQGNGTWHRSFGTPDSINSSMEFYLRDVNRDGRSDIICATAGPAVYFGDGAGGFFPGDTGLPRSNYGLDGISAGDVDNDGGCDVAFVNDQGGVEVWVWNSSSHRWESRSHGLPTADSCYATQLCDMDADGFTDLVVLRRRGIDVWTGDGAGNWTLAASVAVPRPSYYVAMRTGADFDHNGRPDIALVAEEGTWPSEQNWAHAFKESSARDSLNIFPVLPRGGERFIGGSAQFIDWWSEAPAAESSLVKLELSTQGPAGPWTVIAESLKNGGRFQWLVPLSITSHNCYIKYTVSKPGQAVSSITPRPFTIGDPTGCGERPTGRTGLTVRVVPNPAKTWARVVLGVGQPGLVSVRLFDATGRQVLEQCGKGPELRLSVAGLPEGAYFLQVPAGPQLLVSKLVVRH